MPNRPQYANNNRPDVQPPALGPMMVGTVSAGAMFTLWNYARHQKNPYLQYGTLALGGAAVSVAQHLVRGAFKAAAR